MSTAVLSDPLRAVRNEALDCLDHPDRKVISKLAFQYYSGENVEETPEIRHALARWGDLTRVLASQPQTERGWL